jgi:hypothetical protein
MLVMRVKILPNILLKDYRKVGIKQRKAALEFA